MGNGFTLGAEKEHRWGLFGLVGLCPNVWGSEAIVIEVLEDVVTLQNQTHEQKHCISSSYFLL